MFASKIFRRILIGLVLVLCLALGEAWLFAAQKLGDHMHKPLFGGATFDDFCQSSEIGGFPFRLKVTCKSLTAPIRVGTVQLVLKAEEARGTASVFSPNHVVLTLTSPAALQRADGAPFAKLRHDGLTLDVAWSLGGFRQVEIKANALDWRPESPDVGIALNIQQLEASIAPNPAPVTSLHFKLAGQGVTVPALQALLKTTDAAQFSLEGDLSPAPRPLPDWRAALEDWRQRDGAMDIAAFDASAGSSTLHVEGRLKLDESHRAIGQFKLVATGAGPVMARLGLPIAASSAKNILGALLGAPANSNPADDKIALPLRIAEGQIFVGPFRLPAQVQPLY